MLFWPLQKKELGRLWVKSTEPQALKTVRLFLKNYRINHCTVVVAFSGGEDSTTLLAIFAKLRKQFHLNIIAAHLNHGLRDPEELSKEELTLRKITKILDIPLIIEKIPPGILKIETKKNKLSIEEAARNKRYSFLHKILNTTGSAGGYIALGHHLNDTFESEIVRFFQGTRGLKGIPESDGVIIRPILACSKEEIIDFLQTTKLPHSSDSTNNEINFQRNQIRANLIPKIEEIFPGVKKSLSLRREKEKLLDQFIEKSLNLIPVKSQDNKLYICSKSFSEASPYIRIELIYKLFNRLMNGKKKKGYRLPYTFLTPLKKEDLSKKRILLEGHGFKLSKQDIYFILERIE